VAIRVLHARVINCLFSIALEVILHLTNDEFVLVAEVFSNFLQHVEFAVAWVKTFGKDKHGAAAHGGIEGRWRRLSNTAECPCQYFYFRKVVDAVNSTVDSLVRDHPQFVVKGLGLSFSPDVARRINNDGRILGDLGLPFSFDVSFRDLKTTVVSQSKNRSVVSRLSANRIAISLRNTSRIYFNTS